MLSGIALAGQRARRFAASTSVRPARGAGASWLPLALFPPLLEAVGPRAPASSPNCRRWKERKGGVAASSTRETSNPPGREGPPPDCTPCTAAYPLLLQLFDRIPALCLVGAAHCFTSLLQQSSSLARSCPPIESPPHSPMADIENAPQFGAELKVFSHSR